jgi:hypothetical protein
MAKFSDVDKRLATGKNRKIAPKGKRGTLPERDELPESKLDKVTGGVMDDPDAGGQYRRR